MIMAGVTQPTIMETKCCRAMETVRPTGGRPRYRNSAWGSAVNFRMMKSPLQGIAEIYIESITHF